MKTDRNGIPILTYSFDNQNNLKRECHPALHVWVPDNTRQTKNVSEMIDVNHLIVYRYEPVRCCVCSKKDFETHIDYFGH